MCLFELLTQCLSAPNSHFTLLYTSLKLEGINSVCVCARVNRLLLLLGEMLVEGEQTVGVEASLQSKCNVVNCCIPGLQTADK